MTEAENASQMTDKAEQLDQSGNDPFVEKCRTNLGNPTCELTNNGPGIICNNISQHTTLGDVRYVSSNGRSIKDNDRNSNYGQIVKESHCEADCQGLLFESFEQKISLANTDVQSNIVKSCTVVTNFSHTEQQKESLHPEENPAAHSHGHGHDDFYNFENTDVRESDKRYDDIVPGQLTNNCIELSKLKQSDGGIFVSPEIITGEYMKVSNYDIKDQLGPSFQEVTNQSVLQQLKAPPDDTSKSVSCLYQVVLALQSSPKNFARSDEASCRKAVAELKSSAIYGNTTCRSSGVKLRKTPATKVKSEYTLRSSGGRKSPNSSIQEKTAASESDDVVDNVNDGRKSARRKIQRNRKLHDEFSKMKIHLRYLLHRMRYEQNLIDAYSSEGWRGQSLEKLRPEKELQRAKLDINRSKLKIRDLFQRIDAICAEGRFPESLFDSEGLIDSEDIFCAKCGSKNLSRDNDIILCDGACDRGFHQLCLDPPLRTEDIPPGDEGWLCPACDCKFDCIQLLNDSVGTKISNSDSWKHVFPEATKTGSTLDDASGLPSDDSEDDDYNPNGADDDTDDDDDDDNDDMVGNESTSDESDFSSASEDVGAIQKNDHQYLGLPSDDSEDEDYNPNFVDAEEQPKQESSTSDFTSASEDLHAVSNHDEVSSKDGCQMSPSKLVQELDNSMPVSGRRQVEKLDYKKLYDEAYGNASADSSDDEDWNDALTPKRRKNGRRNTSSQSSEGEEWKDAVTPKRRRYGPRNASSSNDLPVAAGGICNVVGDTSTTSKAPLSPKVGASNISQTPKTSSHAKRQPYKRLGEEVTQRLHASFKKNQYPDRSTKEKLAAELGLSPKQVDKWFGNARWSFNHPSAAQDASNSGVASNGVDKAPDVGGKPNRKT